MKVTSRELGLLTALIGVFVFYLLYTFLFNPLIQDIQISKDDLNSVRLQKETVLINADRIDDVIKEQDAIRQEINQKTEAYLPNLAENRIVTLMGATVNSGGPAFTTIRLSQPEVMDLNSIIPQMPQDIAYSYKDLAMQSRGEVPASASGGTSDSSQSSADPSKSVVLRQVTVSFQNGSYEQMMSQLRSIENQKRTIVVDALTFGRTEGSFGGLITYSFYGIEKPDDEDKGLNETPLSDPKGKANPFV